MSWAAAMGSGFGLGLIYFGGLWLNVRRMPFNSSTATHFAIGRITRLGLTVVVFYALLKTGGISAILSGLVGLLAARWCLIRKIGRMADGA
jgi:F1F0 ATPase subunit 2